MFEKELKKINTILSSIEKEKEKIEVRIDEQVEPSENDDSISDILSTLAEKQPLLSENEVCTFLNFQYPQVLIDYFFQDFRIEKQQIFLESITFLLKLFNSYFSQLNEDFKISDTEEKVFYLRKIEKFEKVAEILEKNLKYWIEEYKILSLSSFSVQSFITLLQNLYTYY